MVRPLATMRIWFHSPLFRTLTLSGGIKGKIEPMDSGSRCSSCLWKMLIFIPIQVLRPCSGACRKRPEFIQPLMKKSQRKSKFSYCFWERSQVGKLDPSWTTMAPSFT